MKKRRNASPHSFHGPGNLRYQKGSALLIFVILAGFGMLTVVLGALDSRRIKIERDNVTTRALAQAKAALIAYTLQRGSAAGTARPGEFPCPDTNEDGNEETSCTPGQLGRIPWKTLGAPEPIDGDGETLWYAVVDRFRTRPSNNNPINSDNKPSFLMSVYAADGQTLLTPAGKEAVVVIFSPGAAIGSQTRITGQRNNKTNYLESAGTLTARNNATDSGPFISAPKSSTFNDRVMIITRSDFMPALEKRVAAELLSALQAYKLANGVYPHPASYNDANCILTTLASSSDAVSSSCVSDTTKCRGRVPKMVQPADWPAGALPQWFLDNRWSDVIYYAVGTDFLSGAAASCSPSLTIDSDTNVEVLFFTPGIPTGSNTRPKTTLTTYLEDSANQDGWTGSPPSADVYVTPSSSSNDKLYRLP
ncbi:MAG: hypothetical protein V4568_09270 [Pseudomonadota bacterium]